MRYPFLLTKKAVPLLFFLSFLVSWLHLIVASATSGKVENFKKVSDSILSSPIISEGSLYILTENSKILGFGDQW